MTAEYFHMNYSSDTYTLVFQKNLVSGRGSAGKKSCVAPRNLYILEWVPGIIAKIIHGLYAYTTSVISIKLMPWEVCHFLVQKLTPFIFSQNELK